MNNSDTESQMFVRDGGQKDYTSFKNIVMLHEGAFADTYRAEKAGKYFLLKTPRQCNPALRGVIEREYEIARGLDHPHIASVYGIEEVGELGQCLVMEYVDGVTLDSYLSTDPGKKQRRKLLMQLLSAVSCLHLKNIIHNDLKPQNIMVSTAGGNLKLIDFGLGDDDAHYLFRTLGCTPAYASPELLANASDIDCRSDIYSIGKLMGILVPGSYGTIACKCRMPEKNRRYDSVAAVEEAIKFRDRALFSLPFILAAILAGAAIVLGINSGRREISEIRESVDDSPYESLMAQFDARADSLFREYVKIVGKQPYLPFGYSESTFFLKEAAALRDKIVAGASEKDKDLLEAHYDRSTTEYLDSLYHIAKSLPDYGPDVSYEEMRFYSSLIISGKHYTPYK